MALKKLLSLLSSVAIASTAAIPAVSCGIDAHMPYVNNGGNDNGTNPDVDPDPTDYPIPNLSMYDPNEDVILKNITIKNGISASEWKDIFNCYAKQNYNLKLQMIQLKELNEGINPDQPKSDGSSNDSNQIDPSKFEMISKTQEYHFLWANIWAYISKLEYFVTSIGGTLNLDFSNNNVSINIPDSSNSNKIRAYRILGEVMDAWKQFDKLINDKVWGYNNISESDFNNLSGWKKYSGGKYEYSTFLNQALPMVNAYKIMNQKLFGNTQSYQGMFSKLDTIFLNSISKIVVDNSLLGYSNYISTDVEGVDAPNSYQKVIPKKAESHENQDVINIAKKDNFITNFLPDDSELYFETDLNYPNNQEFINLTASLELKMHELNKQIRFLDPEGKLNIPVNGLIDQKVFIKSEESSKKLIKNINMDNKTTTFPKIDWEKETGSADGEKRTKIHWSVDTAKVSNTDFAKIKFGVEFVFNSKPIDDLIQKWSSRTDEPSQKVVKALQELKNVVNDLLKPVSLVLAKYDYAASFAIIPQAKVPRNYK